jgi:hypothetical protein
MVVMSPGVVLINARAFAQSSASQENIQQVRKGRWHIPPDPGLIPPGPHHPSPLSSHLPPFTRLLSPFSQVTLPSGFVYTEALAKTSRGDGLTSFYLDILSPAQNAGPVDVTVWHRPTLTAS